MLLIIIQSQPITYLSTNEWIAIISMVVIATLAYAALLFRITSSEKTSRRELQLSKQVFDLEMLKMKTDILQIKENHNRHIEDNDNRFNNLHRDNRDDHLRLTTTVENLSKTVNTKFEDLQQTIINTLKR